MGSRYKRRRKEDNRISLSKPIRFSLIVLSIIIIAFGAGNVLKVLTTGTEIITQSKELYKYDNKYSYDTKINLKPNDFVQEDEFVEGQTYLSDLISDIDMNINYNYKGTKKSDITYTYKVEAIMKATYTNTKSSYDVLNKIDTIKEESSEVKDADKFTISEKINVDYAKYHKTMKEFKQTIGISADSQLFIKFTINTSTTINSKKIDNEYVANYKITLGDKVAVIDKVENEGTSKSIKNEEKYEQRQDIDYRLLIGHSCVCFMGMGILWYITRKTRELKTIRNEFKLELNRILKSYEDKIVEIQDLNNIDLEKATKVKDILQLRKLAEEALVPIYSYIKEDEAYFIVTKYENSYIFILK